MTVAIGLGFQKLRVPPFVETTAGDSLGFRVSGCLLLRIEVVGPGSRV